MVYNCQAKRLNKNAEFLQVALKALIWVRKEKYKDSLCSFWVYSDLHYDLVILLIKLVCHTLPTTQCLLLRADHHVKYPTNRLRTTNQTSGS